MIERLVEFLSEATMKIGDKVTIVNNISGHNYSYGDIEYTIVNVPNISGNVPNYILRFPDGRTRNYIMSADFKLVNQKKIEKDSFIKELENIIEFSKDFDFNEDKDFAKSYKVFNIFKEIKSCSSDSDKLEIISKYIK